MIKLHIKKMFLLEFETYARHYFMSNLIEMLEENIEDVECGNIWFSCHDEDSSDEEGFSFYKILLK